MSSTKAFELVKAEINELEAVHTEEREKFLAVQTKYFEEFKNACQIGMSDSLEYIVSIRLLSLYNRSLITAEDATKLLEKLQDGSLDPNEVLQKLIEGQNCGINATDLIAKAV